jgi:hypothetical protein
MKFNVVESFDVEEALMPLSNPSDYYGTYYLRPGVICQEINRKLWNIITPGWNSSDNNELYDNEPHYYIKHTGMKFSVVRRIKQKHTHLLYEDVPKEIKEALAKINKETINAPFNKSAV